MAVDADIAEGANSHALTNGVMLALTRRNREIEKYNVCGEAWRQPVSACAGVAWLLSDMTGE